MGSRSSQPRSGARATDRDLVRSLLRHGASFVEPPPEVVETAAWLTELGLIELRRARSVRCAEPRDKDYPPAVVDCGGVMELREDADEGGGDYRCPVCGRLVYPEADGKQAFDLLGIELRQEGIEGFLVERIGERATGRRFSNGVLNVPLQSQTAYVCLVGYCSDEAWYGRTRAAGLACIYVTVEPDKPRQMLDEEGIPRVEFVDILLGTKDLLSLLEARAARPPTALTNLDVPIYGLGARPIRLAPEQQPKPRRIFHLCLSPEGLLVDGLLAIRAQRRDTAMAIVRIFMETYARAAASGHAVEPMTAKDLINAIDPSAERFEDAANIERQVRRIRKSILDTVRKQTGKPIGEHDVIETVSRSGAEEDVEGYRLNPRSVAIGPLQP